MEAIYIIMIMYRITHIIFFRTFNYYYVFVKYGLFTVMTTVSWIILYGLIDLLNQ